MEFTDFRIGMEFLSGSGRWRVTDLGARTVIAIRVDPVEITTMDTVAETRTTETISKAEAEKIGWFEGPPYGVAEVVFDEYGIDDCSPVRD